MRPLAWFLFSIALGHRIATPYKTIRRVEAISNLKVIIEEEQIELLVVGLPLLASGDPGSQVGDIELFVKKLKTKIKQKIIFENEFLTSVEAIERLKIIKNKNIAKEEIDQMAAAIILEGYLRENMC